MRLEIPGNIVKLTARTTDPKKEKYKGIVIKGIKKLDEFKETTKEDFTTISDNRSYYEFSYFIELKRNLEISKTGASGYTDIYEIEFDKRNKEKILPKENNNSQNENPTNNDTKKQIKSEDANKKKKEIKLMKIASGVYVMKFQLTERKDSRFCSVSRRRGSNYGKAGRLGRAGTRNVVGRAQAGNSTRRGQGSRFTCKGSSYRYLLSDARSRMC